MPCTPPKVPEGLAIRIPVVDDAEKETRLRARVELQDQKLKAFGLKLKALEGLVATWQVETKALKTKIDYVIGMVETIGEKARKGEIYEVRKLLLEEPIPSSSKISKKRKLNESSLPSPPACESPLLKKKKAPSKASTVRPSQIVSDASDTSTDDGSVQVQIGMPMGRHLRFDEETE